MLQLLQLQLQLPLMVELAGPAGRRRSGFFRCHHKGFFRFKLRFQFLALPARFWLLLPARAGREQQQQLAFHPSLSSLAQCCQQEHGSGKKARPCEHAMLKKSILLLTSLSSPLLSPSRLLSHRLPLRVGLSSHSFVWSENFGGQP